jgi:methylphosphotriester-DNA--protein-cysteine methyltransferase
MLKHNEISDKALWLSIKNKDVLLGGNAQLKIYGTLNCKSGKRLKRTNRVFFSSEKDAIDSGFRPCGHCLREAYKKWKLLEKNA